MKIKCPNCMKRLNVPDQYMGGTVKCPACSKPFMAKPNGMLSEARPTKGEPSGTIRTSQPATETCANCGRMIGKLEQARVYEGKVVCVRCDFVLRNTGGQSLGQILILMQNKKQLLGLVGSVMLFIGVFTPIVHVPVLGYLTYFHNGKGDGVIIIALAIASLIITLLKKHKLLWLTGLGSLAVMAFTFIHFPR